MNDNATEEITQDVEPVVLVRSPTPIPGTVTITCPFCKRSHPVYISPKNESRIVTTPCRQGRIKVYY
ncbi:hypothetical protein KJ910_04595 [Patescibacteria group bacterium]|nr:hypothetical protein [Patescibacteria group bacterium]MBU1906696.1 hypothetical protein [Patescibacteria group bacterium]